MTPSGVTDPPDQPRGARGPLPVAEACRGFWTRRLSVRPSDVVYVKGIVEASEGLAALFAESGGELTLAAAPDQADALNRLCHDLELELGQSTRRGRSQ